MQLVNRIGSISVSINGRYAFLFLRHPKTYGMSHKPFVSKMEVSKWYIDDGKGQVKTIDNTTKFQAPGIPKTQTKSRSPPRAPSQDRKPKKVEDTTDHHTLPTIEPEWKRQEPKN